MDTFRMDGKILHADDYRFTDREPYESFQKAVAEGSYSNTPTGWVDFIETRRALSDRNWPEFTDDLDFFDAIDLVGEIEV